MKNSKNIGAIALIDFLGFKGIWKTYKPEALIKTILELNNSLRNSHIPLGKEHWKTAELIFGTRSRVDIFFLSDTLCIIAKESYHNKVYSNEIDLIMDAVVTVSIAASNAYSLFANCGYPLTFRGAVSHGTVYNKGNIILGQAVDNAAQWMNKPEGAFCFYTPELKMEVDKYIKYVESCNDRQDLYIELQREQITHLFKRILVNDYQLPLKGDEKIETSVVNPLVRNGWGFGSDKTIGSILETFRNDDKVVMKKKENTEHFLQVAKTNWQKIIKKQYF